MTARARVVGTFIAVVCIASCGGEAPTEPEAAGTYGDMTKKNDVLDNLELAYARADLIAVEKMLEPDYTFCYQPNASLKCWDRDQDLQLTAALFAPGGAASRAAAVSGSAIEFSTTLGPWVPSTTGDPDRQEGEVIYERLIAYKIIVRGNAASGNATFIIRSYDEAGGRWYLFGIFDHGGHWAAAKAVHESAESN